MGEVGEGDSHENKDDAVKLREKVLYYLAKKMEVRSDYFSTCLLELIFLIPLTLNFLMAVWSTGWIDFESYGNLISCMIVILFFFYLFQTGLADNYRRSIKYPLRLMAEMISDKFFENAKTRYQIEPSIFLDMISWQLDSLIRIINDKTSGFSEELVRLRLRETTRQNYSGEDPDRINYATQLSLINSIKDYSNELIREPFLEYGIDFISKFQEKNSTVEDILSYLTSRYADISMDIKEVVKEITSNDDEDTWTGIRKAIITSLVVGIVLYIIGWFIKTVLNIEIGFG